MTKKEEEVKIIEILRKFKTYDLVLYHCISSYPVDNDQLYY